MTRQSSAPIPDDHGWLITPRALTSLATAVGLVYTLHAPVRYVMQMSATIDALNLRVATLETEVEHQRGTIAAAQQVMVDREGRTPLDEPPPERGVDGEGSRRADRQRPAHR